MALTPPPPSATATLQLNLLKEYLYFSTLFSPQATLLCATTLSTMRKLHGNRNLVCFIHCSSSSSKDSA